ncbi:DUF6348 family protein [Paludisphaera soli]|uniref:DUF6348 family protein n=1 Tax=Paludisphaera soli TaxID=2712865 RepID=UPI0013EBFC6D|nr:DUF6348 family protein [Paludisphaera soli]
MSSAALKVIAEATEEYGPQFADPETLRLGELGLHVRVRAVKGHDEAGGVFIGLFDASEDARRRGIGVTCVGLPPESIKDAAANWCLGVLPVLARWKGGHSCLVAADSFLAPSGRFDVIAGPVVSRGECDGGTHPEVGAFLAMLGGPLARAKLKRRLHWLESFVIRTADGSIDATCRLDNKDWAPGRRILADDASRWPGATASYDSRRQFHLFVPEGGEVERSSLWARLFGRA